RRRGGVARAPQQHQHPRPTGPTARGTAPARRPPRTSRRRAGRPQLRMVAVLLVLLVGFSAIVVRLVQVQALEGEAYIAYGASQRFQTIALPAERGSIFDRNGHDLAVSLPQRTVWANPLLIERPDEVAAALAAPLGLDAEGTLALTERLGSDAGFVYVARRVDDTVADEIEELLLPGVSFLDEPKRFTPSGDLARSLIGQVGVDNEGLAGLEMQFDDLLTGDDGELVIEKDPEGRTIPAGERQLEPAQRGDDLVLTIDRSMQYETERALAAQITAKGAKGGIAIVSRPGTGEILALANLTVDPDTGEVQATGNNMAATAVYEPGSVNKVITVAAALEEGLVSPESLVTVPDSLQVSDHLFTDHDPHPTEDYSVTRILTESSNVGTIKLAQMLGKDRVDSYLRRFGFGTKSALDFPNEAAGILLDPERYSGTSMGSIPIGQGIAVTALQMLEAYNVLANDGMYVPPRLVLETVDPAGARHPLEGVEPHRVVSEQTARQMREMLANVVSEGTGTRGGITGYQVAGKTGTARKPQPGGGYHDESGNYRYVANFVGFVPAERPELSIIVVIDEPAADIFGGTTAAPVFADLAQYALRLFRIPPPLIERPPAPDSAAAAAESDVVDEPTRLRAEPASAPTTTTIPDAGGG
ncbi:MAG: peptidoglycan D,D-transpeptidase FtsI family protein, partial [Acidimicrobiales bacterium]